MGGVAGIVKLDGTCVDEGDLKRALVILAHRGLHGRGTHLDREFGMAHARMATMDISDRAKQPMSAIGDRYWISFDGELYNFPELRDVLAKRGYPFRTLSDTEVVLASFVAWGIECVQQFNGIWAFAVWDSHERVLTLCRDAFGVKPLYYYVDKEQFAYVSEVKGLLGVKSIKLSNDKKGFASAIAHAPLIHATNRTPWTGVKMVLPGHFLQLSANSGELKSIKWWEPLKNLPSIPSHLGERVEVFQTLLENACRVRMRGDIPMGICLSGGLNSSTIWAAAAKLTQTDFSGKVPGKMTASIIASLSECEGEVLRAEHLVELRQTEVFDKHTYHPEDFVENLENLIYAFEQADDLSVERWLLYRSLSQARRYLTIDSAGANELFGRDPLSIRYCAYDGINKLISAKKALQNVQMWKEWTFLGYLPKIAKFKPHQKLVKDDFIGGLARDCLADDYDDIDLPYWESDKSFLSEQNLFFQAKYFLTHCGVLQAQLRKIDSASSSQGVQVRFPYLDPELFRYCLALPSDSVVYQGRTQEILRKAFKGRVSNEILLSSNQYFLPKLHIRWLDGALQGLISDCISNYSFRNYSIFDGKKTAQLALEKRFVDLWPYIQGYLLNERFTEVREESFPEE